jgi:hypothetical protein
MKDPRTFDSGVCYLEVLDESGRKKREIAVPGQITLGRGLDDFTPDVVIPPECLSTSRQHARVELRADLALLVDTSKFGTIVNGQLIERGSVELHDGDEIIFGLPADGWRVRFRAASGTGDVTRRLDPLEALAVWENPRRILIGRHLVEEHLGDRAFRLLKFLADNKGNWYPLPRLTELLWPDADTSPSQADQALSRFKKAINDLLRPYLKGQDAIESWPHKGYCLKLRIGDS